MVRFFLRTPLFLLFLLMAFGMKAQEAAPVVTFYSIDEESDVELTPGESQTAQAPLEITCRANIDDDLGHYRPICEWRIFNSDKGEDSPILTRFDQDIRYTLNHSGGYGIKLYVSFVDTEDEQADTIEYESEVINVVISESKLTCPDGFSPNGDGVNDVFTFQHQSIVKLSGGVFNRWGQKLHTFTLENFDKGWDGRQGGDYVKDGAYLLNIDAVGSDGLHYKIKKTINVLKGFREANSSGGGI